MRLFFRKAPIDRGAASKADTDFSEGGARKGSPMVELPDFNLCEALLVAICVTRLKQRTGQLVRKLILEANNPDKFFEKLWD